MRYLICILVFLLTNTSTVLAADNNGKFAMKGAGLLNCQIFSQERAKQSKAYYMIGGWLEGYLSAHNRYVANTYDISSYQSLELLLKIVSHHCQLNPEDQLHAVVDAIVKKLDSNRLQQESKKVEIQVGQRKVSLYRTTISRLQSKLKALQLYHGDINGKFTDATKSALMAYQSDINYEMTGLPDQSTLWQLFK